MGRSWVKSRRRDTFYREAKARGYRSRAAFKLIQLDAQFDLIYEGDVVLDLGAAPGGWSQVAQELVGDGGRVVAVDRLAMRPLPGLETWRGDLEDPAFRDALCEAVRPVDAVVSDVSPRLSGNRTWDHARSAAFARLALEIATRVLRPGGSFLCKVFPGDELEPFRREVAGRFERTALSSPEASKASSRREMYVVGQGLRADPTPRAPSRGRGTTAPRRAGQGGRGPRRGSTRRRRSGA